MCLRFDWVVGSAGPVKNKRFPVTWKIEIPNRNYSLIECELISTQLQMNLCKEKKTKITDFWLNKPKMQQTIFQTVFIKHLIDNEITTASHHIRTKYFKFFMLNLMKFTWDFDSISEFAIFSNFYFTETFMPI